MLPNVEVTMSWKNTVLAVEQLGANNSMSIGTSSKATLVLNNNLIPDNYIFLARNKDKVTLHIADWMSVVTKNQDVIIVDYTLTKNDHLTVVIGDINLHIRLLDVMAPFFYKPIVKVDNIFMKVLLISACFQLVLLIAFYVNPATPNTKDQYFETIAKFHEVAIKQKVSPKTEVTKSPPKSITNLDSAQNMLSRLGLSEQNKESKKIAGGVGAGVNKVLGQLSSPTKNNTTNQLGSGIRGVNPGGSAATVGIGKMGEGTLTANSAAFGVGKSTLSRGEISIEQGLVTYEGSLTKEEIQQVVEKFMAQIKYCYDREFQKSPELSGKLLAQWVIAAEGKVNTSQMTQNSMGNKNVENCVLRVINRMIFPKPRGGGIVKVNYPFLFSSAGA